MKLISILAVIGLACCTSSCRQFESANAGAGRASIEKKINKLQHRIASLEAEKEKLIQIKKRSNQSQRKKVE